MQQTVKNHFAVNYMAAIKKATHFGVKNALDSFQIWQDSQERKTKKNWRKELCQQCGKNVTHLKHHILRVHTVENVKCPKCEKVFRNPKLLKAHTDNVHEKVPCAHCGKLFGTGSKMSAHIQNQHTSNEDKKH